MTSISHFVLWSFIPGIAGSVFLKCNMNEKENEKKEKWATGIASVCLQGEKWRKKGGRAGERWSLSLSLFPSHVTEGGQGRSRNKQKGGMKEKPHIPQRQCKHTQTRAVCDCLLSLSSLSCFRFVVPFFYFDNSVTHHIVQSSQVTRSTSPPPHHLISSKRRQARSPSSPSPAPIPIEVPPPLAPAPAPPGPPQTPHVRLIDAQLEVEGRHVFEQPPQRALGVPRLLLGVGCGGGEE